MKVGTVQKRDLTHLQYLYAFSRLNSEMSLSPVLTIYDLQVHVHSEDKHLALHADLVERGWRERVRQRHQTHGPTHGARGAGDESRAAADSPRHVDHLKKTGGMNVRSLHARSFKRDKTRI